MSSYSIYRIDDEVADDEVAVVEGLKAGKEHDVR